MRQFYQITLAIVFAIASFSTSANSLLDIEQDSVFLGAGYANDIYYSFENGEIHSVDRKNWDIAFYSNILSAGIITNDGNGVELFTYPHTDTSGWNSIDTTGLSTWPVLYNSIDEWEEGAFNKYSYGSFDYGWGVYNIISHNVIGDSLHIIKSLDGDDNKVYKKLWIEKKASMQNTYYFRFANLDGTNEVSQVINCNDYSDKNFVYYSLLNDTILDREPNSDTWDILFTKYMGINNDTPYPVTGALNNVDIPANRFDEVGPDFDDYMSAPMDSTRSPIGYNWKYFDMGTFSYVVEDSIAFFVSNFQKDVYKLVFSEFDYTVGKIAFSKSRVHTSSINDILGEEVFALYPNPATDVVNLNIDKENNWEIFTISDLSGKVVYSREINQESDISVSIDELNTGMYLVILSSKENFAVQKLIIR